MSATRKKGAPAPSEPRDLFALPELPDLDNLAEPELPDLDEILNPMQPILDQANGELYGDSVEENTAMDDEVIVEQFTAIKEGRRKQAEAIELANDTEYWFAVYFQTREQKEAYLKAMGWFDHGDKYLDGQWVAKQHGLLLPPRPAPYKVGKLDKKLTELT